MKRTLLMVVFLLLGVSSAWARTTFAAEYLIKNGDCLSKIGQTYRISVSELKRINGLKRDLIRIGDTLLIPLQDEYVKSSTTKVVDSSKAKVSKIAKIQLKTRKVHTSYSPYPYKKELKGLRTYKSENAGRDPYLGTSAYAAYLLGVVEKDEIGITTVVLLNDSAGKTSVDPSQLIKKGEQIKMTSNVSKVGDYVSGFQFYVIKAEVYVNGKFRGHMYLSKWCGNWIWKEEKTPPPQPAQPGISIYPPTPEKWEEVPEKEITPEKALMRWDWELFANAGGETDFRGNNNGFAGAEGALYPIIVEGKNARDEFGVGGKVNFWKGETFEKFLYDGGYYAVGPAWKHSNYKGWDTGFKILIGKLWENGNDATGDYKSRREFGIAGISASYSNYERELHGKKFFPEHQLYAALFIPISSDVRHSWQGKNIEDIADLKKFNYMLSIGGRLFLYKGEYLRPYIEAGYFTEDPTTHSLSFRLGVSDVEKIVFAGIGPNINLDHGTWALAGDVGVDIMRAIQVARSHHRKAEMIKSIQQDNRVKSFDENNGVLILN